MTMLGKRAIAMRARYAPLRTIDVRFGARVGLSPYPEPDTYVGENHG